MPEDAPHGSRGLPLAVRRRIAQWGCGRDEMTLLNWSWSWLTRTTQAVAMSEGDKASNKLHDAFSWASLKPNGRCVFQYGVSGEERLSVVWEGFVVPANTHLSVTECQLQPHTVKMWCSWGVHYKLLQNPQGRSCSYFWLSATSRKLSREQLCRIFHACQAFKYQNLNPLLWRWRL